MTILIGCTLAAAQACARGLVFRSRRGSGGSGGRRTTATTCRAETQRSQRRRLRIRKTLAPSHRIVPTAALLFKEIDCTRLRAGAGAHDSTAVLRVLRVLRV